MGRPARLRPLPAIAACALLLALALVLAPRVTGTQGFSWTAASATLHLPRAVLGAVAGVGLAIAGVVLQAVLKNPLADPYTLGISSGASVGAALVIQTGLVAGTVALPATFVGAFAGALVTAALVYAIASTRELAAETLLLAGVAMALFGGALISIMHFLADTIDLFAMLRWTMGSLSTAGWTRVRLAVGFVVVGGLLCVALVRQLDVAALDDDSARGLGVDPVRVRRLAFLGTSIITAGIVAVTGPIGFVGLVVPHAVRGLVGPDPRVVLPCAALAGGALLVACDVLARTLVYPTELPLSAITHAFGCPAFVWILVRRR
ncbi:MAG: iron ABC transporter permease [Planctomycetes bacterium]|nr:iron ABC transporter permease [Planctomycetota bacterium]